MSNLRLTLRFYFNFFLKKMDGSLELRKATVVCVLFDYGIIIVETLLAVLDVVFPSMVQAEVVETVNNA